MDMSIINLHAIISRKVYEQLQKMLLSTTQASR